MKNNDSLAEQIRAYSSGMKFIEKLEVSTVTGSVLVEYDPNQKKEIEKLIDQARQFHLIPGEIDMDQIHSMLEGKWNPAEVPVDIAGGVRFFFSSINEHIQHWTGGKARLNELVPITLFGLGIRDLVLAESAVGPPWHTYFWYAFSTFMIFNRPGQNVKTA